MRPWPSLISLVVGLVALTFPAQAEAQDVAPVDTAAPPSAAPARPVPTNSVEVYGALIDGAVEEFARGHWASARDLFERADAVYPNARALRGLGMSDFNLRAYARATAELEAALVSSTQALDATLREQVEAILLRARPFVARLELRLTPDTARLTIDGAVPVRDAAGRVLVDLGTHTLRIDAPAYIPREERIKVGDAGISVLALVAEPMPAATRALAPAAHDSTPQEELGGSARAIFARRLVAVVGAAFLGTGAASWLRSDARFRDLQHTCRAMAGCRDDEFEFGAVRRLERAAYASFVLGGVLVSTAAAWWWLDTRRSE